MTTLPHENPLTEAKNRALEEELRAAEAAGRKLLDQREQERLRAKRSIPEPEYAI